MLQIGLVFTGIPVSILKKFRRCDAEVFADIEEDLHFLVCHRGYRFPSSYIIIPQVVTPTGYVGRI